MTTTMADGEKLTIQLTVTAAQGAPRVPLEISKTITPTELRKQASDTTKIPDIKLIFRGKMIKDDDSKEAVSEYKLEEGSVVHCMGKPVKNYSTSSTQTASAAVPASSSSTSRTAMPAAGSTVSIQPNAAASLAPPAPVMPPSDPLVAALTTLRASNPPSEYLTAVTTLEKILTNIVNNPMEEKYRKVKKNNPSFQRRLGGKQGGDAAMKAAGFVTQTENEEQNYIMQPSAEAWPKLVAAKEKVEAAVRDAKSATASSGHPTTPSAATSSGMPGGMPSFADMPLDLPVDAQQAVSELMSNPETLQALLQNPEVQQHMRNDPRFANDPMLMQFINQMATNPAMAGQMSQLMRDPNLRQRQSQMLQQMQQQQMGNSNSAASFNQMMQDPNTQRQFQAMAQQMMGQANPSSSSTNGQTQQQQQQQQQQNGSNAGQSGSTDENLTEEEMIAEAIRRSLQDE